MAGGKRKSEVPDPTDSNDIRLPFNGKPSTFVKLALPYANQASKQVQGETGIVVPPIVILTQAGLESSFGKAAPGNMFFGVKAGKGYKGLTQLLRTTEVLPKATGYSFPEVISITPLPPDKKGVVKYRWVVRDYFRKYPTPLGSFVDYARLIAGPRYREALKGKTLKDIFQGIKDKGYATDPDYAGKLTNLATLLQKQINAQAA